MADLPSNSIIPEERIPVFEPIPLNKKPEYRFDMTLSSPALPNFMPVIFQGREAVNELSEFHVLGFSDKRIDPAKAIGTSVRIDFICRNQPLRTLNALCTEISRTNKNDIGIETHLLSSKPHEVSFYKLTLRPHLWWLSQTSNNRIFQKKNVNDIIKVILEENGIQDTQFKAKNNEKKEYCVQFNESNFDFFSRLLEQAGYFWFIIHQNDKEQLIIANDNSQCPKCPEDTKIKHYLNPQSPADTINIISYLRINEQLAIGSYQTTDYPEKEFVHKQAQQGKNTKWFMHDFPGQFHTVSEAEKLSKSRIEGLWSQSRRLIGVSDCRNLVPGHTFTLKKHDDPEVNIEWIVTVVEHHIDPDRFSNRFEAIPKTKALRAPLMAKKSAPPRMLARVTGKKGEEIWTDKHGRIKVQFPWDREGKNDENTTCWLPVMQPWAGTGFGAQFIPRIGQDVVVDFLNGDINRPYVTGCVYNFGAPSPFNAAQNPTQTGVKTQSSKGGGGSNILMFEDKKDHEQIAMQAQKDFIIKVLNDYLLDIGHDETVTIKQNRTHTIKEGNDSLSVDKGKRTVTVGGDEEHTTKGNFKHVVNGNYTLEVKGNLEVKVTGNIEQKTTGNLTQKATGNLQQQATGNIEQKATANMTLEGIMVNCKAKTTASLEATGPLTLKGMPIQQN